MLKSDLDFEESFGDPARVHSLYERAITDFPVSSDLWLDYTRYVDRTLKVLGFTCYYSINCQSSFLYFL